MPHTWLITIFALTLCSLVFAVEQATGVEKNAPLVQRDFWSADAIEWGDGRAYDKPVKKEGPYPQGYKTDFKISVPETGWYELNLTGVGGMRHDLLIDGQFVYHDGPIASGAQGDFVSEDVAKVANLYLKTGDHVLCIQRIGRLSFPLMFYKSFELYAGKNKPENTIAAQKAGVDVMRVGENFVITVTAGGTGSPAVYEILAQDLTNLKSEPQLVGKVEFAATSAPETKTVNVPCNAQGCYRLSARVAGKRLRPAEFRVGDFAVVDVKSLPVADGKMTLIHDIDCIAQTDMGKPIDEKTFYECNGKTRITESKAGRYRESNDCTGPDVEVPQTPVQLPRSYSGFAYQMTLPQVQAAYQLEIEYPDDDRRSVTVPISYISDTTGEMLNGSYAGKSFETGGMFPITNSMQIHRAVFWAPSKTLNIALLSQQIGHRAGAARIRIYQFAGALPVTKIARQDGRSFIHWYEEAGNWEHLVNAPKLEPNQPEIVRDFVGLDRWVQLARYTGMNGISGVGVGYQQAFYRTKVLDGFLASQYDMTRLALLLCEKYGIKYVAEVFPNQWYQDLMVLNRKVKDSTELHPISCQGLLQGPPTAGINTRNALHPIVQENWTNALGELADKLRDSPAFAGITVRADIWLFNGQFTLPSINWGYSDWTIGQFEKDTGIKVPGASSDPLRYVQRFSFLTSESQLPQWNRWRCDRVMDYHRRLRDRIRGDRKDVFFGLVGDGRCDGSYDVPTNIKERFRGLGVDIDRLKTEEGILVMPNSRYGGRNASSKEQEIYDGFLDPDLKSVGFGLVRGFAAYMVYHELGSSIPYDKFGVKAKNFYYCSSVDGSGRNSLEKYAVVLADQDSSLIRDGGNSYIFGDPAIWEPWFAEFRALPALPFTALETARDPVAVWHRACKDGFYFYAVNREQYPVTITLTLSHAGTVTALGSNQTVALKDDHLTLTLEPFALRSFRAGNDATITAAETRVPEERIAFVKHRLVFAQQMADAITTGLRKNSVSEDERNAFNKNVDKAWAAFSGKQYWRARTLLSMAPMMKLYEKFGEMPEGQVLTHFPNMLSPRASGYYQLAEPVIAAETLQKNLVGEAHEKIVDSRDWNSEWGGGKVLNAQDGRLEFELQTPSSGFYRLSIGHISKDLGITAASLNGAALPMPMVTKEINSPETTAFPAVNVPAGRVRVSLKREGAFGIYGVKWVPALRPLSTDYWSVIGPFQGAWGEGPRKSWDNSAIKQNFDRVYDAEKKIDLQGVYLDDGKYERRWTQKHDSIAGIVDKIGVDMTARSASPSYDINFALTHITSPDDRTVQMYFAPDWWANAYINGELIASPLARDVVAKTGAEFVTKHYTTVLIKLHKGVNTLLVKNQGGSQGNSFSLYVSDQPDLTFSPIPPK